MIQNIGRGRHNIRKELLRNHSNTLNIRQSLLSPFLHTSTISLTLMLTLHKAPYSEALGNLYAILFPLSPPLQIAALVCRDIGISCVFLFSSDPSILFCPPLSPLQLMLPFVQLFTRNTRLESGFRCFQDLFRQTWFIHTRPGQSDLFHGLVPIT